MSEEPPDPIRLIRGFVNTAEPELGTDQLVPTTAATSLHRIGLVEDGAHLVAADLRLLVGVREGLRQLLLGHAGPEPGERSRDELDAILGEVPLTIRLAGDEVSIRAVESRISHRVIAAVLSAVVAARPEDWLRLKVCARDSCRWAFYDTSRNRSGRWCSMAGCGNIVKMRRAYRTRKAGSAPRSAD